MLSVTVANGLNGGINGGRICWTISGTFCLHKIQGSYAKTQLSCKSCSFFKKVKEKECTWPVVSDDPLEEGFRILVRIILRKIMEKRAEEREAIEQQNQGQLNYEI